MLVATSEQADAQILYVGNGSSDQTTSFTSGTTADTGAFIGNTSTDSNNTLNVLNPGTHLTINGGNVQVGFAGSGNSMVISIKRVLPGFSWHGRVVLGASTP